MDDTINELTPTLKAPAYDVAHQHKFPEGGKLDVPEAPKPKDLTKPVMETDHKSQFAPNPEDKPPVPPDLAGE